MTAAARKLQRTPRSLTRQAPRGVTRAMMTLATFVTDDPSAQAQLPQVLIVSSKLTSAAEIEAWRGILPANVVVWREARCWMTTPLIARLLRLLSASSRFLWPERCAISSADAFRAHMTRPARVTAHRLGFYYHLIPVRMTWALQPCDRHVSATSSAAWPSKLWAMPHERRAGCWRSACSSRRSAAQSKASCGRGLGPLPSGTPGSLGSKSMLVPGRCASWARRRPLTAATTCHLSPCCAKSFLGGQSSRSKTSSGRFCRSAPERPLQHRPSGASA